MSELDRNGIMKTKIRKQFDEKVRPTDINCTQNADCDDENTMYRCIYFISVTGVEQ